SIATTGQLVPTPYHSARAAFLLPRPVGHSTTSTSGPGSISSTGSSRSPDPQPPTSLVTPMPTRSRSVSVIQRPDMPTTSSSSERGCLTERCDELGVEEGGVGTPHGVDAADERAAREGQAAESPA